MLGEKIKFERKKRGMTQAEISGEKITRNMISRIESGLATPSLDTLYYIADRLSLPVSYLLADECDGQTYLRLSLMPRIRECYHKDDYKHAIKLSQSVLGEDDELMLILAHSNFALGKAAALSGALKSGLTYLKSALEYSKKTIYDTSKIECIAPLYAAICKNIQSPLLEFDKDEFTSSFSDGFELEFYHYLIMDSAYEYQNQTYRAHLFAKGLITKRDYEGALEVLVPLIDDIRRSGYNAFVMLGIYTDIENCYRQIGDYENAYRYARKRMSLGEGFNS